MDDFLAKPVSLDRLKDVLKLWFPTEKSIGQRTEPPIDMDKLRELSDGDTAVERQLLEQLHATNDADAAAMRRALSKQDMALVAHSAHRMAGANMMIGAAAFASACRTIAHAGRNDDAAAVAAALPLFDTERGRLHACLEQVDAGVQNAVPSIAAPLLSPAASLPFLIVDDHAFQRHSMRMLLGQPGAGRIAEATDGQAALRLIGNRKAALTSSSATSTCPTWMAWNWAAILAGLLIAPSSCRVRTNRPCWHRLAPCRKPMASACWASLKSRSASTCLLRCSPDTSTVLRHTSKYCER
jgi:HPt (histidine-containing phosphotransfer) domain-containing protein